jgi:hypothetical protein
MDAHRPHDQRCTVQIKSDFNRTSTQHGALDPNPTSRHQSVGWNRRSDLSRWFSNLRPPSRLPQRDIRAPPSTCSAVMRHSSYHRMPQKLNRHHTNPKPAPNLAFTIRKPYPGEPLDTAEGRVGLTEVQCRDGHPPSTINAPIVNTGAGEPRALRDSAHDRISHQPR